MPEFNFKEPDLGAKKSFVTKAPARLSTKVDKQTMGIKDRLNPMFVDPINNDYMEEAALRQSAGEKWMNGLAKATYTAGVSAIDPFVSLTYGIGEFAKKGVVDSDWNFANIFNNSVNQGLDTMGEYLQESLPNLYTKEEKDASVAAGLLTANFWADKFLNGAGFMAGAVLSSYLSAGLGSGRAANTLAKSFTKNNKALDGLAKSAEIEAAAAGIVGVSRDSAKRAIQNFIQGSVAAWGESSIEARGVIKQVRERLIAEELANKGLETEAQLDPETIDFINSQSNAAGNVVFSINMPIVGLTNAVTLRQALKGFNTTSKSAARAGEKYSKRIVEGADNFTDAGISGLQKVGKYGSNAVSEMFQEGAQFATEQGTTDIYTNYNNYGKGSLNNFIEGTFTGLKNTFSEKEGIESMLLGAMLGGGVGAFQTKSEIGEENKNIKSIVEELNKWKATDVFKNYYKSGTEALNKIAESKKAVVRKDRYKFNTLKDELITDYLLSRYKAGMKDVVNDELDSINKLGDAEFKKLFDIDENISEEELTKFRQDQMANFKKKAAVAETIYDNIQKSFGGYPAEIKDKFYKLSTSVSNYDERIKDLKTHFADVTATGTVYDKIPNILRPAQTGIEVSDLLESIERINSNPESVVETGKEIQDLENRRKELHSKLETSKEEDYVGIQSILAELQTNKEKLDELAIDYSVATGNIGEIIQRLDGLKPEAKAQAKEYLTDIIKLSNDKASTINYYNKLTDNKEAQVRFYRENLFDGLLSGMSKPTKEEAAEEIKKQREAVNNNPDLTDEQKQAHNEAFDEAEKDLADDIEEDEKTDTAVKTEVDGVGYDDLMADFFQSGKDFEAEEAAKAEQPVAEPTVKDVVVKETVKEKIEKARKKIAAVPADFDSILERVEYIRSVVLEKFKDRQEYNEKQIADSVAYLNKEIANLNLQEFYDAADSDTTIEDTPFHKKVLNGDVRIEFITGGQEIAIANLEKAKMITSEEAQEALANGTFLAASIVINQGVIRIKHLEKTGDLDPKLIKGIQNVYNPNMDFLNILEEAESVLTVVEDNTLSENTKEVLTSINKIKVLENKYSNKSAKSTNKKAAEYNEKLSDEISELLDWLASVTGITPAEKTPQETAKDVKDKVFEPVNVQDPIADNTAEVFKFEAPKKTDSVTASGSFFAFDGDRVSRDNTGEAIRDTSTEGKKYQDFINGFGTYNINDIANGDYFFETEISDVKFAKPTVTFSDEELQELADALNLTVDEVIEIGTKPIVLKLKSKTSNDSKGESYLHQLFRVTEEYMGFTSRAMALAKDSGMDFKDAMASLLKAERLRLLAYRIDLLDKIEKGKTIIPISSIKGGHYNFTNKETDVEKVLGSLDSIPLAIYDAESKTLKFNNGKSIKPTMPLKAGVIYTMVKGYGGQYVPLPLKTRKLRQNEITSVAVALLKLTAGSSKGASTAMYSIEKLIGKNRVVVQGNKVIIKKYSYVNGELKNNESTYLVTPNEDGNFSFEKQEGTDLDLDALLEDINLQVSPMDIGQDVDFLMYTADGTKRIKQSYVEYLRENQALTTSISKTEYKYVQPNVYLDNPIQGEGELKKELENEPIIETVNEKAGIEYRRNRNKEQKNEGAPVMEGENGKWLAYYTPEKDKGYVSFSTQKEALKWIDAKYDAEVGALESKSETVESLEKEKLERIEQVKKQWSENVDSKGFPKEALPPLIEAVNVEYANKIKALEQPSEVNEEDEGQIQNQFGDESPYRLVSFNKENYDLEDVQKGTEWFNKNFGSNISVVTYSRLLQVGDNIAHGYFSTAVDKLGGTISLWDGAEQGTLYHEAFHAVFRMFLNNNERAIILKAKRNEEGNSNKTDMQLEELLAEDFRDYVLTDGKTKDVNKSFFQSLKELIESFWDLITGKRKNNLTVDSLFNKINTGGFKDAQISNEILETLRPVYSLKTMGNLTPIQSADILEGLDIQLNKFIFNPTNRVSLRYLTSGGGLAKLDEFYNGFFKVYESAKEKALADNKPKTAASFQKILDNKDVIKLAHVKHLKKYDLNISVDEDQLTEVYEGGTFTLNKKESNEIDMKDNMKAEIKFYLDNIPMTDFNGRAVLNSYGFYKKGDWQSTYKYLQKKLANTSSRDELFLELEKLASRRPEIKYIVNNLKTQSVTFRTAFAQTFMQQKNNYTLTLINPETGEIYRKFNTGRTAEESVVEEWFSNFKYKAFIVEDGEGNLEIKPEAVKALYDKVKTLQAKSVKTKKNFFQEYVAIAEEIGVVYSKKALQSLTTEDENTIIENISYVIKDLSGLRTTNTSVFIFNEVSKNLKNLAVYEADIRQDLQNDVHLNANNKPVYGYSLTTTLNEIVNKFNNGDLQGTDLTLFAANSLFLKQIKEGTKIQLVISEGIATDGSGGTGIHYRDLSLGDYSANEITNMLYNITVTPNNQSAKTIVSNYTASDKSTAYGIQGFDLLLTVDEVNAMSGNMVNRQKDMTAEDLEDLDMANSSLDKLGKEAASKVKDVFYGYFLDELSRIIYTRVQLGLVDINSPYSIAMKAYLGDLADSILSAEVLPKEKWVLPYHSTDGVNPNGNGTKFTMFEDILSPEIKEYFEKGGSNLTYDIKEKIENDIMAYIKKQTQITNKFFQDNNVYKIRRGKVVNIGISDSILKKYEMNPMSTKEGDRPDFSIGTVNALTTHFTLNYLMGKIELSKLVLGDLAFYKDLIKRVPALQATGKVCLTGEEVNTEIQNTIYNESPNTKDWIVTDEATMLVVDDLIRNSENDESIKELMPFIDKVFTKAGFSQEYIDSIKEKFNDTNSTDGSTWSTLETFKEYHVRLGDWDAQLQEPIYQKALRGDTITQQEYMNLAGFKSVKAVVTGKQNTDSKVQPFVYIKTAVAPPLFKSLVKGTELEKVADIMYKSKANYITVRSSSKASTFNPAPLFNNNGTINTEYDYGKNVFTMPWSSFRENLEVDPFKEQDTVTMISQAPKLAWTGVFENGKIKSKKKITVGNEEVTMQDAWNNFNLAYKELAERGAKELKEKFGVDYNPDTNSYKITNLEGVIALIEEEIDDLPSNLKEQLRIVEDENGNKKLLMPLDVTTLGNKIQQKLNNIISERVVRQKTNGSTNVLVSNAGFYSVENDSIKRSSDLSVRVDSKKGLVLQVRLPHHFKTLFGDNNLDNVDPRLLEMIGFRVPIQGLNSMHKLEVVGFSPKEAGDVIILPAVITTISGADFDIDKLYIFKPNHSKDKNVKRFKVIRTADILQELLNNEDSLVSYLLAKQERAETDLAKQLIQKDIDYILANKTEIATLFAELDEEQLRQINQASYTEERVNEKGKVSEVLQELFPSNEDFLKMSVIKKVLTMYNREVEEARSTYAVDYLDVDLNETPIADLTKAELQNLIFETYLGLLGNQNNLDRQLTPNNADSILNLRNELDKLRMTEEEFNKLYSTKNGVIKRKAPSYTSYIQFVDNARYFITFLSGKAGVGQTAVHNTHHVLSQIYDLKIASEAFNNIKLPANLDKKGNILLGGDKALDGSYISETISQFLTAFVDIAKDPFVFDINANTFTINTILLMVRAGTPLNYIGYFMNQPIIKDYVDMTISNDSEIIQAIRQDYTKKVYKNKEDIIRSLKNKYMLSDYAESTPKVYTEQELKEGISGYSNSKRITHMQLDVLSYFLNLQELSKQLQEVMRASDTDSKAVPKELWLVDNKIDLIKRANENTNFINVDKIIDYDYIMGYETKENPNFIEYMTKNSIVNAQRWYGEDLFLQQSPAFKSLFKEMLKKELLNEDDVDIRKYTTVEASVKKVRQMLMFYPAANDLLGNGNEAIKSLFFTAYNIPKEIKRFLKKGYNLPALKQLNSTEPLYTLGASRKGKFKVNGRYIVTVGDLVRHTSIDEYVGGKSQFIKDLGYRDEYQLLNSENKEAIDFYTSKFGDSYEGILLAQVLGFEEADIATDKKGGSIISLPRLLLELRKDIKDTENSGTKHYLSDNILLNMLVPDLAYRTGDADRINFNNKVGDPELKELLIQQWEQALLDTRPVIIQGQDTEMTVGDLFTKLAQYAVFQSGLQDNPYSMHRLIPGELYTKLMNTFTDSPADWYNDFTDFISDEVVSNMVNDNNIVPVVRAKDTKPFNYTIEGDKKAIYERVGLITSGKADNPARNYKYIKVPFVKKYSKKQRKNLITWELYRNVGTNISGDSVFMRIPVKGESNKLVEMGFDADDSIIQSNNLGFPKEYKAYVLSKKEEVYVPEVIEEVEEVEEVENENTSIKPKGTINVYWGQAESTTSTKILSNLAPRKFIYQGKDYSSVEHAYQSLKSGSFDQITYDKYVKAGGYGTKIRGKAITQGFDNLQLMRDLVIESFIQNPNSEATKKLLEYENFTHNTNEIIDRAFLEGLKLAQKKLLLNQTTFNTNLEDLIRNLTEKFLSLSPAQQAASLNSFSGTFVKVTNIQELEAQVRVLASNFSVDTLEQKLKECYVLL